MGDYVFGATLTQELKEEIQRRTQAQLTEMLGVDVDNVMAEYVVVMIGNKKSMDQITHDLVDFIGDEHAQEFVKWLSVMLPTLESGNATNEDDGDDLAPPTDDSNNTQGEPAKRVISLKSVTSSSLATTEKKVVSLTGSGSSGTTIRSLNRSGEDLRDMLARRSQRFGVTTALPDRKDSQSKNKDKENDRGTKRKAEDKDKRPGSASGRLSQLLGPPVTVDQAELDARDSLNTNKRKKSGRGGDDRDNRGGKKFDRDNQKDSDGNDRRQNRRRQDKDETNGDQPPLPPSPTGDRDRNRGGRNDRNDRDGRDPRGPPHQGNFRGPPGFGGYPPPPFGHPMYFPPPYGMGMPPYGMGFPPHHQGPFMGPPMPQGPPKQHFQPRGAPRPFQNKTWVNPNAAKPEGETTADGNAVGGAGGANTGPGGAAPFNSKPTNYAPRNPYFAQSQMRPRFQNKTWVRQDLAQEEQLSNSLPQTPPPEEAKNDTAME